MKIYASYLPGTKALLALLAVVSCCSVQGQETVPAASNLGTMVGPFRFLPSLGLSYGHNDNLARTDFAEVDSYFHVISPGIRIELPSDTSLLSLTWEYDFGRYDYEFGSLDDYDDRNLSLDFTWDPNVRHSFEAYATDVEGHDPRGQGSRQGPGGLLPLPVDTWESTALGGSWTYGAAGANGQLTIGAGINDLEYTNNPEFTRYRDYDGRHLNGAFSWRIMPKTLLGLGIDSSDYRYDESKPFGDGSLDNTATAWFITLDWDLAAKTTGSVQFGRQSKDFDSETRGNYDNTYWVADIEWRPRTYSAFALSTSNAAYETDGFGDYIQREVYSLDWEHYWRSHVSTTLELGTGTEDHQPHLRKDDIDWWGISGRWQLSTHFQLGAGWQYFQRDSSLFLYSYEQNIWTLTLEGSL